MVSTVVMMNAKRLGMTSGAYTVRGKVNTQRKVMLSAEGRGRWERWREGVMFNVSR